VLCEAPAAPHLAPVLPVAVKQVPLLAQSATTWMLPAVRLTTFSCLSAASSTCRSSWGLPTFLMYPVSLPGAAAAAAAAVAAAVHGFMLAVPLLLLLLLKEVPMQHSLLNLFMSLLHLLQDLLQRLMAAPECCSTPVLPAAATVVQNPMQQISGSLTAASATASATPAAAAAAALDEGISINWAARRGRRLYLDCCCQCMLWLSACELLQLANLIRSAGMSSSCLSCRWCCTCASCLGRTAAVMTALEL